MPLTCPFWGVAILVVGSVKYGKTDANQAAIVEALRQAGCSVFVTSDVADGFPDIIASRAGVNYLLEIKTERGKLTADQKRWHMEWRGQVAIVRSREEALKAVGLL